jgi:hypothetical protein
LNFINQLFISNFLFFYCVSAACIAQDSVATGYYKMTLFKSYDKEKIEKECLEKAKLNAIENAFGVFLVDSSNHTLSSFRKNDLENTNVTYKNTINSIISGKWVRDIEPPIYSYFEMDGYNWLSIRVKGLVREIKPKSFNEDKEAMAKYLRELYLKYPFNDVTIVENYENKYLISVVDLTSSSYKSNSDMNRVAQTKARAQVSRYINGTFIEDIFIIKSTDIKNDQNEGLAETFSAIKESSFGWVNSLELLTVFRDEISLKTVYIYSKKIENERK